MHLFVRQYSWNDSSLRPIPGTSVYSVPLDPPPPTPSPVPTSPPAGAEGPSAKRAQPKPIVAPPAHIPNRAATAAPVASTGDATRSGADSAGTGTSGGTAGTGTGSGGSGDGNGSAFGAGSSRAVKIAGDITATRDYPARTRSARIGTSVIVVLTVGTDGRVLGCRIHQPSPDTEADTITCRLARERFRFRPATNRAGNPIESEFGWRQRWFAP